MIKLIKRVYNWYMPFHKTMTRDNIFAIAAQTAFFLILSAVPLVMFLLSIFQRLNIPSEALNYLIRTESKELDITVYTESLARMYDDSVGISIISAIATLWSASKGIHAITNGLNRIHNTYENRNWFLIRFRSMIHTLFFMLIILATISIIFLGNTISDLIEPYIGHLPGYIVVIYSLRYVLMFLYQVFFFAIIYRNVPNLSRYKRREYGIRCQLPGALFCATSWHVLLVVISVYVTDFNGFSIYKGLTQLAIVMIFLYFCMACMMIGAEINVYFHYQIDWYTRFISIRHIRRKHHRKKIERARKKELEMIKEKSDAEATDIISSKKSELPEDSEADDSDNSENSEKSEADDSDKPENSENSEADDSDKPK